MFLDYFLSVLLEINTEALFVDLSSPNIQKSPGLARNCIILAKTTKKKKRIETEKQEARKPRNKITMRKEKAPFSIWFELAGNMACSVYCIRSESLVSHSSMNCFASINYQIVPFN